MRFITKEEATRLAFLHGAEDFPSRYLTSSGVGYLMEFGRRYVKNFDNWNHDAVIGEIHAAINNYCMGEKPQYEFSKFNTFSRNPEIVRFDEDEHIEYVWGSNNEPPL